MKESVVNKKIPLKNIIPIEYPKKEDEWKIHLASKEPSTNTEPLDEFLKNPDIMLEWNRSKKPNGEDKKTGKKKYSIKWHKYIFHSQPSLILLRVLLPLHQKDLAPCPETKNFPLFL